MLRARRIYDNLPIFTPYDAAAKETLPDHLGLARLTTKSSSGQASSSQLLAQNAALRATLLATGVRQRKDLGAFTASTGTTTRIKLFNVGILTGVLLKITLTVTIGTANATVSPRGPYNAISRVRLTDYDQTDRVNCSGFQLWLLDSVRERNPFGYNNGGLSAVFTNPNVPVAVGNQTITFWLYVPVAYDVDNPVLQLQDLRGAMLMQTNTGEVYLNIDWINSLYGNGDIDSLYNGAATTTVVGNPAAPSNFITVNAWQDFIMPQNINGQLPLPMVDLQTVYEINGMLRSTDNIAANTEKLISYPNLRAVIGSYYQYVTNGAVAQGNVTKYRLLANGNQILRDELELARLISMRRYLENDLVAGVHFRNFREKPIETWLFGNVQEGITPGTVNNGNQFVEVMYESFYTKGTALPGLAQAQ